MVERRFLVGFSFLFMGTLACSGGSPDTLTNDLDSGSDSGDNLHADDGATERLDASSSGDGDAAVVSDAAVLSDAAVDAAVVSDASSLDGSPGIEADASDGATADAGDPCVVGSAENAATTGTLDVLGQIAYFADGADLPAGTYRLVYEDGCMKYGGGQDWTIHAYPSPNESYAWFAGGSVGDKLVRTPGTNGYASSNGAYVEFDDCVAANLALAPVEFTFAGGKLGVWLSDSPYGDNMVGVDNRNPRWRLERVDCE